MPVPSGKPYSYIRGFEGETLPAVLLEQCCQFPKEVAFRQKKLGIYKETTYGELKEHIEKLCLGFRELGLQKGDRVAIMGDNCPEWIYADFAAQSLGAITYGIYQTSSALQVKELLEDAEARFFIAQNQEHVDKVLAVENELSHLEKIIVADTRGLFAYRHSKIISFEEVEKIGSRVKENNPGLFEGLVSGVKPDDISFICYTSGTTGKPKGALFTHRNILWGWLNTLETEPKYFLESLEGKHSIVSYMPLAHLVGKSMAAWNPILSGAKVFYPERPDLVPETIFETAPTVMVGPPRFYEKLAAQMISGIENSSWVKKQVYHLAMSIGRRYIKRKWDDDVPFYLAFLYKVAWWVAFRPILDKIGFVRVKTALITAAAVPPEIVTLWQIWGINMREGYGMTECGSVAGQHGNFPRPGNVGSPAPRVEVRITDEGEALVLSPANFRGYWKNEEATSEVLKDGWVYTGDIVELTERGQLRVVDRKKDIMVTAGGKNIAPAEIEKALKASPYISECIVFADGRKYPSALIEIDFDTVSEWARSRGIAYTTFASLATHPEVYTLIGEEIEKANATLARVEAVKAFRIIPKELDPEDETDPITPTRKVQRRRMYQKFRNWVEEMYSTEEQMKIKAEIGELWNQL